MKNLTLLLLALLSFTLFLPASAVAPAKAKSLSAQRGAGWLKQKLRTPTRRLSARATEPSPVAPPVTIPGDTCPSSATSLSTDPAVVQRRSSFSGTVLDPRSFARYVLGGTGAYEHVNGTAMLDQAYRRDVQAYRDAAMGRRAVYQVGGALLKRLPISYISPLMVRLVEDPDPDHKMHISEDTAIFARDLPQMFDMMLEDKTWAKFTFKHYEFSRSSIVRIKSDLDAALRRKDFRASSLPGLKRREAL